MIFVQFSDESLGDVVWCALAHAWFILLTKSREETERQCLWLIASIRDRRLDDVLDFLALDGRFEKIQYRARRLLFLEMNNEKDVEIEKKTNERFQDELASILHRFERPDKHMTLDCD